MGDTPTTEHVDHLWANRDVALRLVIVLLTPSGDTPITGCIKHFGFNRDTPISGGKKDEDTSMRWNILNRLYM